MRVALVGLGPSSLNYIAFVDRAGDRRKVFDEVWTINSYCSVIESDLLFHMDNFYVQELRAAKNDRVKYMLEAMKRYKNPIMTSVPHPDYPTCKRFPLEEVVSRYKSIYFNNTAAYAIAYAGLRGVSALTCFGLDFTWPDQKGAEAGRGCCEYWLGKISDKTNVRVSEHSTLMDGRLNRNGKLKLYGFSDGYDISLEQVGNKVGLRFVEVPLPDPEAVERRYYHGREEYAELILEKYKDPKTGEAREVVTDRDLSPEGEKALSPEAIGNGAASQVRQG